MPFRRPLLDRRRQGGRSPVQTRKIERFYSAQLRKIARQIGELISGAPPSTILDSVLMTDRLRKYADLIGPWAQATAERMVGDVAQADRRAWRQHAAEMGRQLLREIDEAPTGVVHREAMQRQVELIKSLPTEAAERVHKLVTEGLTTGARSDQVAAEIMRSGEVAQSRADTIARTEVSRAASTLTQARAEHAGSVGYIWRTAHDGGVRPSHKAMEGRFVAWDAPPELDGMTGHAGRLPNCRCWCEVTLPELD